MAFIATVALLLSLVAFTAVTTAPAYAAGPCRVTGYSIHARLAMIDRDISKSEVRQTVSQYCSSGYRQANGNWKYRSTSAFLPTVILSNNGTVVTTYWEGSGGGGGGGGGGGW